MYPLSKPRRQLTSYELGEINERQNLLNAANNTYGIQEQPVKRSENIRASIKRLRSKLVFDYNSGRWVSPQQYESKLDLMVNINYWKEHGRLPDKNLAKVRGKGMYHD